jgi:selenocysteine lyase/cysteine desulfurase
MESLRTQFPICDRIAYLNAGSDGPLPRAAVEAAQAEIARIDDEGRTVAHFYRRADLMAELREAFAGALGTPAEEIALMSSTSEGLARVLLGLDLAPGDEVLTARTEHPGLIAPLRALHAQGVAVRAVDLADIADAVTEDTTLVACSHVDWLTGKLAPAALAEVDVPVLLDGAQGVGAIPTDVRELGCAAYAAPGQKWLCGADGTGFLWLEPGFADEVRPVMPTIWNLEDPKDGWDSPLRAGALRHDTFSLAAEVVTTTIASIGVLSAHGWDAVHEAGAALAATLAERLRDAGRTVRDRDRTTLVTFEDPDPVATAERLAGQGISVRSLPNSPYLRASVGAWNDESDLDRLLSALSG